MMGRMSADTIATVLKLHRHGIEKEEIERITGYSKTSVNRVIRYDRLIDDDPQMAKEKAGINGEDGVVKHLFALRGLQWDEPKDVIEICEGDTIALLHQLIGRLDVLLDICRAINEALR